MLLGAIIGLFGLSTRHETVSVRVTGDGLLGLDQNGVVLWHRAFGLLNEPAYDTEQRRSWVGNFAGEGTSVLFVPIPAGIVQEAVPLVCLDARGKERWRFTPGKTVRRRTDVFAAPFVVRQFAVMGQHIIVTSHHHLYYASQVAVLDARGRLLREYWHPGHLNSLATGTYSGRPVAFLGGVNNVRHAATLVALDPEQLAGAAIEGGRPAFEGMPAPTEAARFLFPRSGLNLTDPYNVVVHLVATPGNLVVDVHERLSGANPPSIQYHLNDRLDLSQVAVSDVFLSEYAQRTRRPWTTTEEMALHHLTRIH